MSLILKKTKIKIKPTLKKKKLKIMVIFKQLIIITAM